MPSPTEMLDKKHLKTFKEMMTQQAVKGKKRTWLRVNPEKTPMSPAAP